MDIKKELDQELESYKPQAKETGAEALKLQQAGKQLEAQTPPAPTSQPLVGSQAVKSSANSDPFLERFMPADEGASPAEAGLEAPAADEADPFLQKFMPADTPEAASDPFLDKFMPQEEAPGRGELFAGALARGAAQVASAPVDIAGIAAEATGNSEAAQAAFDQARLIESYAPQRFQKFENINDGEAFASWLVEFVGEQAPVLAAIFSGYGGGAMLGRAIGARLVSPAMAGKIGGVAGGYGVGAGLETAGAGSEFKQRTGEYNSERALAVGAANGLLEFYGPAKLLATSGKKLTEEMLLGFGRESLTELAQETNTAANAAWIDENYDFFSRETAFRLAEAGLGGGISGAAVAGGVRKLQDVTDSRPEDVDFGVKETWSNALTYIREKARSAKQLTQDSVLDWIGRGQDDALEVSPLLREVKAYVKGDQLRSATLDAVADFEDAITPRYAVKGSDGKWGSTFYTDTDVEEVLATRPQREVGELKEVDMKSLRAGGLTATVRDLPTTRWDSRIFFAPRVKAAEREMLLNEYGQLEAQIQQVDNLKLTGTPEQKAAAEAALEASYGQLLNKGLRVVPSRGASFVYKGDFGGETKLTYNRAARSPFVMLLPRGSSVQDQIAPGTTFTVPKGSEHRGSNTAEEMGYVPVAVDLNKVKFNDGLSIPPDVIGVEQRFSNERSYIFQKKDLTADEKNALIRDYISTYKSMLNNRPINKKSADMMKPIALAMAQKGIMLNPRLADQYMLGQEGATNLKKFTVGKFTPTPDNTEINPRLFEQQRIAKPATGKVTSSIDYNKLMPEYQLSFKRAEARVRALHVSMSKLLADLGIPKLDLEFGATSPYGSHYDSFGAKVFLAFYSEEGGRQAYGGNSPISIEDMVALSYLHEVGHHITIYKWQTLPADQQALIMQGYERARLKFSLTQSAATTHLAPGEKFNAFQSGYSLTFVEYLAEQFRRYSQEAYIFNKAGPFYKDVGTALEKVADAWVANNPKSTAVDMLYPSWEFYSVMRYIEDAARVDQEQQQGKTKYGVLKSQFLLPESLDSLENSPEYVLTLEMIEAWKKALPADVDVELTGDRLEGGGAAEFRQNDLLPGRSTIRLWTGALQRRGGQNPLAHEATHAIWHLLTAGQRKILSEAGRSARVMDKALERRYFADYKRQLRKLEINEQDANQLANGYVDEEYAAWLVGKRFNGTDFGPQANSILDRILQLLESVKNMLLGRGFDSAEKIMLAIQKGEIAHRQARRVDTQTKVVKRGIFSDIKDKVKAKALNKFPQEAVAKYEAAATFDDFLATRFEQSDGGSVTMDEARKLYEAWGQGTDSVEKALAAAGYMTQRIAGATRVVGLSQSPLSKIIEKGEVEQRTKSEGNFDQLQPANDANIGIVKKQLEPGEPVNFHYQGNGVYFLEQIYDGGRTRKYVIYKYDGGVVKGSPRQKIERLLNLGEFVGEMELALRGSKGFEVVQVEIEEKFRFGKSGVPYSDNLYDFVFNTQLKQEARPSGLLEQPGYRMWLRRNPASVRWHVWDEVSKLWYSPNRIRGNLALYLEEANNQAKLYNRPKEKTPTWVNVQKYRRLEAKVNPEAWTDPSLSKAFAINPTKDIAWEQYLQQLRRAGMIAENQLEQAITGRSEGQTVDPFMAIAAEKQQASQAANAKRLGVDFDVAAPAQPELAPLNAIFDRWGINNPTLGPMLNGQQLGAEADRINWFTKLAISIKQMSWNNPHIQQLRDYVGAKDALNALRMKWIERAQETVKAWDKISGGNVAKDAVSDLLFWATEMEYLGPNDPPRWFTQQELAAAAQRLRVTQQGMDIFRRVTADLQAYLVEVEQVMTETITNQYTSMGPNGRLVLSPAGQAELNQLKADMAAMRMRPYFPMVRFGQWTVTIRDPAANGKVVWFSAYATARERDAAAIQLKRRFPTENMQVGHMSPEIYEFQGLPPAILKYIKNNFPGQLTQQQKDYLDAVALQMAPERSFRKRWLRRTGTAGYSLDGMRVYAHYFQGAGSYLAKIKYKPVMEDAIRSLKDSLKLMKDASKKRTTIIRFMEADMKYSLEPSKDWHKFRSAVAIWQLGFSPAAAFVNFTQTPVFTLPYFAGIYGSKKAYGLMAAVAKSTKRAVTYSPAKADPQFAAVRQALINMGKLETGAAPELGAYSQGGNLLESVAGTNAQRAWRAFTRTSMFMFQQAERLNREIVLGLGWELSADINHPHMQEIGNQYALEILNLANTPVDIGNGQQVRISYDTATRLISIREAISRTQFEYGRDYRPPFLRSPLASSFLVFFGYIQAAAYAFGNNPGTVQLLLTFVLLFGVAGLPGAEDLEELVNAVARTYFGKDFSLEVKARELVNELSQGSVFEETGADLFLHGLSRYSFGPGLLQEGLGIPQFDASANGSMGRLIPGFAETMRAVGRGDDWKGVTSELARDVAGAGFGQIFPMIQFLSGVASGDISAGDWKKWEAVMPRAVKAMSKAGRYYVDEEVTTASGNSLGVKFDLRDPDDIATLIAQGLGFAPTQVNMTWDKIMMQNDTRKFYQNERTTLMTQLSYAIREKDTAARATTMKSIQSFNKEMQSLGLGAMAITAEGIKQSLKQRAVARAKQEAGLPTQKSATPLYQKIEKLFPGIEEVE